MPATDLQRAKRKRPGAFMFLVVFVLLFAFCEIALADTIFTASLDGSQEVPAVNSNAAAVGTVILNAAETEVTVTIYIAGLTGTQLATGIHGPAASGSNGPLIIYLQPGNVTESFPVTPQQALHLKSGFWYFQVKTAELPSGEIRGQINPPIQSSQTLFPASSGSLDATFGTNGVLTTPVGSGNAVAQAVAVQADGKIVAVGYAFNGTNNDFAIVRYNPDGTLDDTFDGTAGGNGIVTFSVVASDDEALAMAIQSDGKIVLAGQAFNGTDTDFAVVRLNTDGTPDASFDGDGRVTVAIGPGSDVARSVAVQEDGKIVVAGNGSNGTNNDFAVVRLMPNGSLDTSFDGNSGTGNGIVRTAVGTGNDLGYAVNIKRDGSIFVAGYYFSGVSNDTAVVKYQADGRLDTSFDGDGIFVHTFSTDTDEALAMTLQPDGKIVIAGCIRNGAPNDFLLSRIAADGSLDQTFGNGGVLIVPFSPVADIALSVAVQNDGKIVAAGFASNGSNNDFGVVRVNANGSPDPTFDFDGRAQTMIGISTDSANAVTIQADGKIVVAGRAVIGSNALFGVIRYGYGTNSGQTDGFFALDQVIAIRFDNAYSNGNVVTAPVTSAGLPSLPVCWSYIGTPRILRTTALFSGNVIVRLNLPAGISAANFNSVRVLQFESGTWNDRTAETPARDFVTRSIYARLTTLSPFVAASPQGQVPGSASISGRILASGRLDPGNVVSLSPLSGTVRSSFSNPFGYYTVRGLNVGGNYLIRAASKRLKTIPRIVSVNEVLFGIDIVSRQ